MSLYSNIPKDPNESTLGGVKYELMFCSAKAVTACPQLPTVKTLDAHFQIATGAFVFADVDDGFNKISAINHSGKLEWESVGNPGTLKGKNTVEFEVAGMQAALARFVALSKNDDLLLVIQRTDCTGKRFLIGGCCLPARVIKFKGGVGTKPEDDVKTMFTIEAYSEGMPVILDDAIVLPEPV